MKKVKIYWRPDFDYEVFDIFIEINGVELHYKGFDDVDWEQMDAEISFLVENYGFEYLGEKEEIEIDIYD